MEFSKQIMFIVSIYQLYLSRCLKPYKIGLSDYPVMLYLFGHSAPSNPIGQNEIARGLKKDKALIARAARNLHKLGYISILGDPQNKSKKILCLTRKGHEIVPHIKNYIASWEKRVLSDLRKEETELFNEYFDRIFASSENLFDLIYGSNKNPNK